MPFETLRKAVEIRAQELREDSHINAEPGEQMEWLCQQLLEYPKRVDERYTTNLQFLMVSAARTIANQAVQIEQLKKQLESAVTPAKVIVVANISGGVLQGASSNGPVELHTLDFDDVPHDDPSRVIEVEGSEAYHSEVSARIDPGFVDHVVNAVIEADEDANPDSE